MCCEECVSPFRDDAIRLLLRGCEEIGAEDLLAQELYKVRVLYQLVPARVPAARDEHLTLVFNSSFRSSIRRAMRPRTSRTSHVNWAFPPAHWWTSYGIVCF